MIQLIKNAVTGTGKGTLKILCTMIIVLFAAFGCEKYEPEQIDGQEGQDTITIKDYSLDGSGCSWNFANIEQDSLYVINSETEFMAFITGSQPPSIDFEKYSLLLVQGNASVFEITKDFQQLAEHEYALNIEMILDNAIPLKQWHFALVVSKLDANAIVTLNLHLMNTNAKVLILQVDYLTNTFLGGKEFVFSNNSDTFTIINEYKSPVDFGYLKLYYKEIDELLFHGTIIWEGRGKIIFPDSLLLPDQFQMDINNYVFPQNGFEVVFNQYGGHTDYASVWDSVKSLVKVGEYLQSNPNQKVKIFLYAPTVGGVDYSVASWIIYLKR